uniref:Proteasome activator complex subunit 4 C-terminal domain-containing protein n=1 Tax=Palpitomonas bilix TaxID=652834 RepID=A0A7S3D3M3_9EUKA
MNRLRSLLSTFCVSSRFIRINIVEPPLSRIVASLFMNTSVDYGEFRLHVGEERVQKVQETLKRQSDELKGLKLMLWTDLLKLGTGSVSFSLAEVQGRSIGEITSFVEKECEGLVASQAKTASESHWHVQLRVMSAYRILLNVCDVPSKGMLEFILHASAHGNPQVQLMGVTILGMLVTALSGPKRKPDLEAGLETIRQNIYTSWFETPVASDEQHKEYEEKALYRDKYWFGWYSLPTLRADEKRSGRAERFSRIFDDAVSHTGETAEDILKFLGEKLLNDEYLASMLESLVVVHDILSKEYSFDSTHAHVLKALVRLFGLPFVKKLLSYVARIIPSASSRNSAEGGEHDIEQVAADRVRMQQCLAAEIIGAIARGMKHASISEVDMIRDELTTVTRQAMMNSHNETTRIWASLFQFCFYDIDPRRPIVQLMKDIVIMEPIIDPTLSVANQAKKLRYMTYFCSENAWRITENNAYILEKLQDTLSHQLRHVRDRTARLISKLVTSAWPLPESRAVVSKQGDDGSIDARVLKFLHFGFERFADTVEEVLSTPNTAATTEQKQRLLTWLHTVMLCLREGRGGKTLVVVLSEYLSPLFKIVSIEDEEIPTTIRVVLALVTQSDISVELVRKLIRGVSTFITSKVWSVRRQIAGFVHLLVYHYRMFLADDDPLWEEIVGMLTVLLHDSNAEVRDSACGFLSGMFVGLKEGSKDDGKEGNFVMSVSSVTRHFTAMLAKRGPEKFSGIQGLIAIVRTQPYTVPNWMPAILYKVAQFTHAPDPVGSVVQKHLKDWWRTHRDTWHEHKHKFTEEEEEAINDVLVCSYYC